MAKKENIMTMQEFVNAIAEKNEMTKEDAAQAYHAVINGIKEFVANGKKLQLYGFGCFYLQLHKGHKMQFQPNKNETDDYLVLKFSASSSLNKHIRDGKFKNKKNALNSDNAEIINNNTDNIIMTAEYDENNEIIDA